MIVCPYCDEENIEGSDACEHCGQAINELHLPTPATATEVSLLKDHVNVLEPKKPIVVTSQTSVQDVLNLLVENRIGCVLVVDDGKLTGIFSERDALMRISVNAEAESDRPISDFMTPSPQALATDAKVAFAVHRMDLGGYRHVPIVDGEGHAVGIISVRDILGYLTERMGS